MVIYTKKGDRGKTNLFNRPKSQVSKDSLRVSAVGAIDELNSLLGIASSFSENPDLSGQIKEIQKDLLIIGSILAGANLRFYKSKTKNLEKKIDKLEGRLPPLKNFILPGGSKLAVHFQYARALVRRTEREVIALSRQEKVKPQILSYLNRLSDFLFMLAREANYKTGIPEEIWVPKKK